MSLPGASKSPAYTLYCCGYALVAAPNANCKHASWPVALATPRAPRRMICCTTLALVALQVCYPVSQIQVDQLPAPTCTPALSCHQPSAHTNQNHILAHHFTFPHPRPHHSTCMLSLQVCRFESGLCPAATGGAASTRAQKAPLATSHLAGAKPCRVVPCPCPKPRPMRAPRLHCQGGASAPLQVWLWPWLQHAAPSRVHCCQNAQHGLVSRTAQRSACIMLHQAASCAIQFGQHRLHHSSPHMLVVHASALSANIAASEA